MLLPVSGPQVPFRVVVPTGPMELSVVLCDDGHIRELNAEWRGKDEPTDVLSFEIP